jgi:hypothetical protein
MEFSGSESAKCWWKDSATIKIFPDLSTSSGIQKAISIGSTITLLDNTRLYNSKCVVNNNNVLCSISDMARRQTVLVQESSIPIFPSVNIKTAQVIPSCSTLRLDLTNTGGDVGRIWTSVKVKVQPLVKQSNTTSIRNAILSKFSTSLPIVISSDLTLAGEIYNITISLCNSFLRCGAGSVQIEVTDTAQSAPIVNIAGDNYRSIYRPDSLSFHSVAYTMKCGGKQSSAGLSMANSEEVNSIYTIDKCSVYVEGGVCI